MLLRLVNKYHKFRKHEFLVVAFQICIIRGNAFLCNKEYLNLFLAHTKLRLRIHKTITIGHFSVCFPNHTEIRYSAEDAVDLEYGVRIYF